MCAQRHNARKGRPRQPIPKTLPDDLFDYNDEPAPRISPPRGSPPQVFDVERLPVIDDWPDEVPITEAEIQVFERWFADVFDEMFGQLPPAKSLTKLSSGDNEKP